MSVESMNPLAKHFRQPAIYLSLPSDGKFWPDDAIQLTMDKQIAVYPMTTRDEITIRTPDALLNGQSVISVIQSCCPQIKDAWKAPGIDIDALLIGIRIASYGQNMDVDTVCPNQECKHENNHTLDLTQVLDRIGRPNYDAPLLVNDLKFKLKPQSYFENNKANQSTFEEQRLLGVVQNDEIAEEEKIKQFEKHLKRMIDLNIELMAAGTEYIETADGTKVTNPAFILEFYQNTDSKTIKTIREKFESLAKTTELPKPNIQCSECNTEYPVLITFDYSRFFEPAS